MFLRQSSVCLLYTSVLCLVIGSVLAVATISSIPIYSNSIMQRMLQKDLQSYQQETNVYPGRYLISQSLTKNGQDYQTGKENLSHLNEMVNQAYAERLGIPVQLSVQRYESVPLQSLVEKMCIRDRLRTTTWKLNECMGEAHYRF